jgi:DNA-directed RNA polymerase specialized sigma24 family protein
MIILGRRVIEDAAELSAAIERALHSRLRGHPMLEDAIQEAHIEAWRRLDAGDHFGSALHMAIWRGNDVAKGKRAFGAPERSPGSGSRKPLLTSYEERTETLGDWASAPPVDPERAAFVDDVLSLLEPVERFIVESMVEGYTHGEIAEALDRSVAAVRKRMPTIRTKLTPALEELRAA